MNDLKDKKVTKYKVIFTLYDKIISVKNISYMNKESVVRRARVISNNFGKNVKFKIEKINK